MKFSRRSLMLGSLFALLPHAASARRLKGVGINTPTFRQTAIGGGGFVTGIDVASDGTMVARVDVFGAYACSGTGAWRQLVTTNSMPASLVGMNGGHQILNQGGLGAYEIRIAPSNPSVFYMLVAGAMLVSTNSGAHWTLMSNFPAINWSDDANSGPRLLQLKMAVHPTNPDIVYIGTPVNGLYKTTNGRSGASATFTQVTGVADPITAGYPAQCVGSISGNVLTVTSVSKGPLTFGQSLLGTGISSSVLIFGQASGTAGGAGTYNLSNAPNLSSRTFYADARNGVRGIVFDLSTSGGTQKIYACTDAGVIITVDNGTTWTLIPNSPTTVTDACVSGGVFYATTQSAVFLATASWTTASTTIPLSFYRNLVGTTVINASDSNRVIGTVASMNASGVTLAAAAAFASVGSSDVLEFVSRAVGGYTPSGVDGASGSWVTIYTDNGGASGVAVNPNNSAWMVTLSNGGGNFNQTGSLGSTNTWSGTYFFEGGNPTTPPSDVGWVADTRPGYPSSFPSSNNWAGVCIRFDPLVANRVWMAWGYGVSYFDLPNATFSSGTMMAWAMHVAGMEMMVARCVFSAAGYAPVISVEDEQVFRITDPRVYPSGSGLTTPAYGLGNRYNNSAAWCLDGSRSVAGVLSVLSTGYYVGSNGNYSAYSTDGGATWTVFPNRPTTIDGGCITGVDANHHVAVGASFSVPKFTADAGATPWTNCSGLPTGDWIAGSSKYNCTQIMTNDAAGNVYLYFGGGGANGGTYRSLDKGANFTHVNSTDLTAPEFFQPTLKAVPGIAGKLFFSIGSGPNGSNFYTALDSGGGTITWTTVANVEDVYCFGFGAVAPGFTAPTLWLVGWVNPGSGFQYGVWRSRDLGVSDWQFLVDYPNGNPDLPVCISGDMNDYTKCYIGFQGTTFVDGAGIV